MVGSPNHMNQYERAFIFMAIALHIGLFIKVGCESQKWTQIEFILAYFVCILIFIQFLIRYFSLTYVYKTENSISSWALSLSIVITNLVLIQSTLYPPFWFLVYGILMVLAALKNRQSIARLRSVTETNTQGIVSIQERIASIEEFSILESGFGVFMILFYILAKVESRILPQLSLDNTIFFGTLFTVYFSIYCAVIMIRKMLKNKKFIEELMKELP